MSGRIFEFRMKVFEGSDEFWDQLADVADMKAAKILADELADFLDDIGFVSDVVPVVITKQGGLSKPEDKANDGS